MEWPTVCVTTSHYVAVVEGGCAVREYIHRGAGIYHGLTWDREALWFSARRSLCHPFPAEVILRYGHGGCTIRHPLHCLPFPFAEIHQIHWQDFRLYFTAAQYEQLARVSRKDFEVIHQGQPGAHINSVWLDQRSSYIWFIEHNLSSHTGIQSRVVCGDLLGGRSEAAFMGRDAHNVFADERGIHVLSSATGHILRRKELDSTDTETVRVDPALYLRGMAVVGDRIVVGGSHVGARDSRHDHRTPGHLFLLDRESLQVLDRRQIPAAGQVGEVRALEDDEAHNGLPVPG